jgi:putative ABC transport system permease protein
MIQDLRFALRSLRNAPGFTVVALLIVAIGIGAATTMFSAVDALVLRPVALPEPERLVAVYETNLPRNQPFFSVSFRNYVDWVEQARTFASLGAVETRTMNLTGQGEPEAVEVSAVTASFLPTVGIPTILGRNFSKEEDRKGGPPVAMLSEASWERRFGRSPDVLGQALLLDGVPHVLVGVSGPTGALPGPVEILVPMATAPEDVSRTHHDLWAVGRLREGVSLEAADAELKAIAARIYASLPESERGWSTRLVPYAREVVGDDVRRGLFVLLGAVGLVLLVACANLSNLLLVRSSARAFELAIRTALGAGRARIVRQIVTESVLVTVLGGVVGVLLAAWGVDLLRTLPLPRAGQIGLDLRVLAAACVTILLAGVVAALAPALRASAVRPQEALKGRSPRASHRSYWRDAMVVAQLGTSLTLLVGVALMARSFGRLVDVDPGFRPDHALAVAVRPAVNAAPPPGKGSFEPSAVRFYERLGERVRALPGVTAAGVVNSLPLTPRNTSLNVFPAGSAVVPAGESVQANWRLVDGGYFDAVGIPLVRGRTFAGLSPEEARRAVVVSASLARSLWADADPIGRQLDPGGNGRMLTVIGVVGDVRAQRLSSLPVPTFYWSMHRFLYGAMHLVVRTAGEPSAMLPAVRAAAQEIDASVPVFRVSTLADLRSDSLRQEKLLLGFLGGFGAVALLLAALGTYGVMAFTTQQRTREIGLRIAVGARPADILRIVLGQGARLVAAGALVGLVGALASARVLSSLLYETGTADPLAYLVALGTLAMGGLLAAYVPARRATRVDPMVALRAE